MLDAWNFTVCRTFESVSLMDLFVIPLCNRPLRAGALLRAFPISARIFSGFVS